jgi:hypothetical protein
MHFYLAVLCSLINVMCLLSNINTTITVLKGSKVDRIKYNVYGRWQCKVSENFFSNIHGSVHRDSLLIRSNEMRQYAGVYLLQNYSTCFGCLSNPSSGVNQTVTAASGTGHITCQSNNLPPLWPN